MSEQSGKSDRKSLRQEAARREILRREQALGVPEERQVYVLRQHFDDEGGPPSLSTAEFARNIKAGLFTSDVWSHQIKRAPTDWVPPEIVFESPRRRPQEPGDFCEILGLMIFSLRARLALGTMLSEAGIFLPVTSKLGEFVGFRLDAVNDALDEERATVNWSTNVARTYRYASSISRYAFHTERLVNTPFFRIPVHWHLLVLHPFMQAARTAGLTGMTFCRVWPNAGDGSYWSHKPNWC